MNKDIIFIIIVPSIILSCIGIGICRQVFKDCNKNIELKEIVI